MSYLDDLYAKYGVSDAENRIGDVTSRLTKRTKAAPKTLQDLREFIVTGTPAISNINNQIRDLEARDAQTFTKGLRKNSDIFDPTQRIALAQGAQDQGTAQRNALNRTLSLLGGTIEDRVGGIRDVMATRNEADKTSLTGAQSAYERALAKVEAQLTEDERARVDARSRSGGSGSATALKLDAEKQAAQLEARRALNADALANEDDIISRRVTREDLIRQLALRYPEYSQEEIANIVYNEIYPDDVLSATGASSSGRGVPSMPQAIVGSSNPGQPTAGQVLGKIPAGVGSTLSSIKNQSGITNILGNLRRGFNKLY